MAQRLWVLVLLEQRVAGVNPLKLIGNLYTLVLAARIIDFLFNPHTSSCQEPMYWYIKLFFILTDVGLLSVPAICFLYWKEFDFFKIQMLLYIIASIGSLYDDIAGYNFYAIMVEIILFLIALKITHSYFRKK